MEIFSCFESSTELGDGVAQSVGKILNMEISLAMCRISCDNDDDDMECDRVTRRHCRTFRSTRLFDVTFPVNCARS